jgi:hypothetical protein
MFANRTLLEWHGWLDQRLDCEVNRGETAIAQNDKKSIRDNMRA